MYLPERRYLLPEFSFQNLEFNLSKLTGQDIYLQEGLSM